MSGVINIALIPYHSIAASAVINTPTQALETEINKHLAGSAYNHFLSEIYADAITGELASGVTVGSALTDLRTRFFQWAIVLDKIMDGATGTSDWAAKYGALPANANLTNLYNIINARTSAATPNTTMSRDASGNAAVVGLTATSVTATTITGHLVGNADSASSVAAAGITGTVADASIAGTIARAANVPTNAGAGATGTWGISITGNAATASAVAGSNITGIIPIAKIPAIPYTQIIDLQANATGTTMVVTVKGGALVNANGNLRIVNDGTVTLIAPTTGNQWALIHYDVNATSPSVMYGTVGGNSDTAVLPVGSTPIQWVFLRQNCTAITQTDDTISTHGYLAARPQFIALQSTAAAGGGAVIAPATLATIGAPATSGAPNGISAQAILNGTASGVNINGVTFTPYPTAGVGSNVGLAAISTGNNGGGTSDGLLSDLLGGSFGGALELAPHNYLTVSGANVTLAGGAVLMINGHIKVNASAVTVSLTSGSAVTGLRYVFADSTSNGGVSGNEFTLNVVAAAFAAAVPAAPNANSRLIAIVHYSSVDGADPASIDFSAFGLVSPGQHRLGASYSAPTGAGTSVMTNTTWVRHNTFTPVKLKRTKSMSYLLHGAIRLVNPTVRTVVACDLRLNANSEADATSGANLDLSQYSTITVDPTTMPDVTIPLGPVVWNAGPGTDYVHMGGFQFATGSTTLYWGWLSIIPSAI